jgi:hypothetical protein
MFFKNIYLVKCPLGYQQIEKAHRASTMKNQK